MLHKNKKITIKIAGRVTSITMQEILFRLLSLKLSGRTDDVRTVSKWLENRLTDHLGTSTLSIGRESTISGLSAYCSMYALEEVAQADLLKIVDNEYYNTFE